VVCGINRVGRAIIEDMRKNLICAAILVCVLSVVAFSQEKMMKPERSKTDPLKIGETAPDFSLVDDSGKTVTLSNVKQLTVLVFYRGYW